MCIPIAATHLGPPRSRLSDNPLRSARVCDTTQIKIGDRVRVRSGQYIITAIVVSIPVSEWISARYFSEFDGVSENPVPSASNA